MQFVISDASTSALDLEFFWLEEDDDGGILNFIALDGEEFACHSAACRPPGSGGTGGSNDAGDAPAPKKKGVVKGVHAGGGSVDTGLPKGPPMSDDTMQALFIARRTENGKPVLTGKVQHESGVMSVEGMNADGTFQTFKPGTEAKAAKQWELLGLSKEKATENLVKTAEIAMGYDPKTGQFDEGKLAEGRLISKWYTTQGARLKELAETEGVDLDAVVAAATVLSAGRLWDGVKNGNYETAAALVGILKKDEPIEITQAHIDFMNWRASKGEKSTSKIGLDANLTPGQKVKPSELDSAQLVETLYAVNAMRGYDKFDHWVADSTKDGVIGGKTPRLHAVKDAPEPPYPLFTSKGTNQVQQAVAVLRGDVTARDAVSGPKYSSFFSNLRRPDLDYSSTNDTWHYRVMAGNEVLNPMKKKGEFQPGTIRELTTKDNATNFVKNADGSLKLDKKGNPLPLTQTAQDNMQTGVSSASENLRDGDIMFRDSTQITRNALTELQAKHPEQFGDMKLHEVQALVWVYYGGGKSSDDERSANWDNALDMLDN